VVEEFANNPEIDGSSPTATQHQERVAEEKLLEITLPNGSSTVVEQLDYDPEIEGQKPDAA
jgi:hypothetical protein